MLELKNLSKYYNTANIVTIGLKKINLKLDKNEIVAITGESGSGKSTLLNVICGVDTYEDGEMYFNGNETSYFNQDDLDQYRQNNVAFISQNYNIIDSYTALENVMVPLLVKGCTKKDAQKRAFELLKEVGLEKRIKTKGVKLSGGEKQRCVIARALATDCKILACDEPTGNLDKKTGDQIIDLIHKVSKDKLVLIVTHNYEQIEDIVTRTIRIHDGEIVEDKIKESNNDALVSKEENTLSYNENNRKNLLNIVYYNLKNTPKKTILSSVIFCFFWFLLLYFILSSVSINENNKYTRNPNYNYTLNNRLVVYNKDYNQLNPSDFEGIKGDVYFNSTYEDFQYKVYFKDYYLDYREKNSDVFVSSFTNYMPNNVVHLNGTKLINNTDVYILFPKDMADKYSDKMLSYIGCEMGINKPNINLPLNLCGYGICDELDEIMLVTNYRLDGELNDSYMENLSFTIGDFNFNSYDFNSDVDKITIYYTGPTKPTFNSVNVVFNNIYSSIYNENEIDIIYYYSELESAFAYLPYDLEMNVLYQASIYTDDVENVSEKLIDLGYCVVQPGKNGIDYNSNENIYFMLYVTSCFLTTIVLFFISYFVISRVYSSKDKEYTILRSNGVLKKKMKFVVNVEVILTGALMSIVVFIIFYILSIIPNSMFNVMKYNTIGISILYFISSVIFSYLISVKINKRLFKYSIATSIKNGGVKND